MSETIARGQFIPALRFRFLTPLFDSFMTVALPDAEIKQRLVEEAGIDSGMRVLDFGCGTATLTLLVRRRFPGAHVRGLDVDEEILAKARRKAAADGADVGLDVYDGGRFPYSDGTFDRVVTCFVLHHLSNEQKKAAFSEIRRVLAPGGQILVADFDRARNWVRRLAFMVVRLVDGRRNTSANARGKLREMMSRAGLLGVQELSRHPSLMGEVAFIRGVKNPA